MKKLQVAAPQISSGIPNSFFLSCPELITPHADPSRGTGCKTEVSSSGDMDPSISAGSSASVSAVPAMR